MPQLLYPLLLLACPLGMGLMTWLMLRGGAHRGRAGSPVTRAELDELRRELADLRAAREDTGQPLRN
ncbi:hypothetical protein OHS71_08820 [Streptomyces sp. NBC_00377]|uniref:hypothetical protein n=1 Tax=unclassified Streptomyces TaxID=2593676 RepID=UPI002E228F59|nr:MULTISPECIES: hypothetical protein [unclassified Streptomyces]